MNRTGSERLITKKDAVIILLIITAAALFATFGILRREGTSAVISVDGHTIMTLKLDSENCTFEPESAKGAVIELNSGRIRVKSSDCPDKICVNTGYISKEGEKIVCLPKKLIIEISSEK